MDALRNVTGLEGPEAYATTAAMTLEHLGNLFAFLDQRLGHLVIFDPQAQVQEATVREAIKIGSLVCRLMATEGPKHGADPAVMREVWDALVQEAVRRSAGPTGRD
jgi:hypothetical protein